MPDDDMAARLEPASTPTSRSGSCPTATPSPSIRATSTTSSPSSSRTSRSGRDQLGPRPALREWFVRAFAKFKASIHFVGNHIIDLDDEDHAHGVVYCRDEIERPGEWMVGMIQYWDTYERRDGLWYFKRRRLMRWYGVDALSRPAAGVSIDRGSVRQGLLPDAWPSWQRYWDEVAAMGE